MCHVDTSEVRDGFSQAIQPRHWSTQAISMASILVPSNPSSSTVQNDVRFGVWGVAKLIKRYKVRLPANQEA
jgi:hypothetical protein